MAAVVNFPVPDPDHPDERYHRRQLAASVRGLMDGNTNAANDFDLDVAPAVATTVVDPRVGPSSRIILTPGNIHAANDLASGTIEIPPNLLKNGQFTISHVASPLVRSFRASILS